MLRKKKIQRILHVTCQNVYQMRPSVTAQSAKLYLHEVYFIATQHGLMQKQVL